MCLEAYIEKCEHCIDSAAAALLTSANANHLTSANANHLTSANAKHYLTCGPIYILERGIEKEVFRAIGTAAGGLAKRATHCTQQVTGSIRRKQTDNI